MFSHRFPESFEPTRFARRLAARRREGAFLLDLTESNPTRVGLGDYVDPAAWAQLADAGARVYEPEPAGLLAAREAVATYHADRGASVPPGQVVLTASTSEAYAHLFRLLCDPGDAVLVARPSYPLFEPLAAAEGVHLLHYPLRYRDGAWRLDAAELHAALRGSGSRVRAVVVVQPNNPTGSFLDEAEAQTVVGVCGANGVALIADEVFGDFRRPGQASSARATFAGEEAVLTFVLSGLSKTCGLPQLKLGWIAASGPTAARDAALERLHWLADSFLSVGTPVQRALTALLAGRGQFQEAVRQRLEANRALLATTAAGLSGVHLLAGNGGWNAVIDLPAVRSEEEWALALLEHDVIVHPGFYYEFEAGPTLVLSLLPEPALFARALAVLGELAR